MTAVARSLARGEETLRQLELAVTHKLDGLIQGDHEGRVLGEGSEPGEVQLYRPGDDIRRIDWNLTARTGQVHARRTIADRELETWVVVDGSASLDYGTANHEKRDLAASVVGAFGFLTVRAGNRLGAVIFDGTHTRIIPPQSGRAAVYALAGQLERRPRADVPTSAVAPTEGQADDTPAPQGPLAAALRRTRHLASRRGLVIVVSDLLEQSDWADELRALTARHEVIVAHVTDPREDHIPAVGVLALVDPETGQRREVQTSSRRFRERYAAGAQARRERSREMVRRNRAGYLPVSTNRDWLRDVVQHVVIRRRRR